MGKNPGGTLKDAEATLLLKETSRSVYLTLRALPGPARGPISLAYLLARATDTIADTDVIAVEGRLEALEQWRERIMGRRAKALDFEALASSQASASEQALLRRGEEVACLLDRFEEADRRRIRGVLDIIISGQELDLRIFRAARAGGIVALESDAALEDYTYRVAGCVGEFWTEVCLAHLFTATAEETGRLRAQGVRFGKGLQMINILRDLPQDLRKGRCYLPAPRLAEAGLAPEDLLDAGNMGRFRGLYDAYLDLAEGHLAAGWEYVNGLPAGQMRVRLGCAWFILIGAGTLRKLRVENVLDASRRVKISRSEVYGVVARSTLFYPWKGLWRGQFRPLSKPVASPGDFR